MTRSVGVKLVLIAAVVVLAACGSSDGDSSGTVMPSPSPAPGGADTAGPDAGPIDGGGEEGDRDVDMDAESIDPGDTSGDGDAETPPDGGRGCGETTCGPGEECVDQECRPKSEDKCQQVETIGSIGPGESLSIDGTFGAQLDDSLQNACTGASESPEKVYRLEVEEGVRITPVVDTDGQFSATVEFRRDCATRDEETDVCSTGSRSLYADAGTSWYVVFEKDAGVPGDFSLTLEASRACSFGPPGVSTCRDDDRFVCQEEATEQKFDCPTGCIDENCHGHSCQNPIMIDGVGDGQTYSGDMAAYEANINFANGDKSCKIDDVAAASKGAEVYFRVKADEDDEIVVDTSGDAWDNLVYITNRCSSVTSGMLCHASWETDQEKTWSVPKDGTYWVIVDKRYVGSGDPDQEDGMFNYRVDVR